jgi:hypothetical protein
MIGLTKRQEYFLLPLYVGFVLQNLIFSANPAFQKQKTEKGAMCPTTLPLYHSREDL